jgi:hypothetical protein
MRKGLVAVTKGGTLVILACRLAQRAAYGVGSS